MPKVHLKQQSQADVFIMKEALLEAKKIFLMP